MTSYTASQMNEARYQRGAILLEVLIALIILALVGSAMVRLAAQQIIAVGQVRDKVYASWVADNQLVQLRLQSGLHLSSWVQGTSLMGGQMWHWRYKYQDSDLPHVALLEIEVWGNGQGAPLERLSTLVAQP